jgi:DNA polymerase
VAVQHFVGADEFVPATRDVAKLARAAQSCQGCDLYARATQAVFGAGPVPVGLMLVGEQPGDVEDTKGEPFVGPAGGVLDRALGVAGIDRSATYLTNAVKHFRWKSTGTGKRRLHDKPSLAQVGACRPWLTAELAAVRPAVLVALGATAAAALFGSAFRLTQHRGETLDWPPPAGVYIADPTPIHGVIATIHPSAVLRADDERRDEMFEGLVDDLSRAAALAKRTAAAP